MLPKIVITSALQSLEETAYDFCCGHRDKSVREQMAKQEAGQMVVCLDGKSGADLKAGVVEWSETYREHDEIDQNKDDLYDDKNDYFQLAHNSLSILQSGCKIFPLLHRRYIFYYMVYRYPNVMALSGALRLCLQISILSICLLASTGTFNLKP